MRLAVAAAALLAVAMSVPASAAIYLFTVQGTAVAFPGSPGSTPIAEVATLHGSQVFAAFEVDSSLATFTPGVPAGGQGTSGLWSGSVQQAVIGIGGVALIRNSNDLGGIFLVDNGGIPSNPSGRVDQATISSGARVISGSLVGSYDTFGLPDDIFLNSLAFGRTRVGDVDNLPTLVTDVTQRPDFLSFLLDPGGTGPFMSLQFRRGNPSDPTQIRSLPVHSISVTNLQFQVQEVSAVPEPRSWVLLIAGCALVGVMQRQRRSLAA